MEPDDDRTLAEGTLQGVPWAVLVSSQGGRLLVGSPERPGGGPLSAKPQAFGFGPITIGYAGAGSDRAVLLFGTTVPALRQVQVEDEEGDLIETAVAHLKRDLGFNVYLALCRTRPRRVVATTISGDGGFMNVTRLVAGFQTS